MWFPSWVVSWFIFEKKPCGFPSGELLHGKPHGRPCGGFAVYRYVGARHTLTGRGRCNQGRQSTTSLCGLCASRSTVLPFVAVSLGRLALALIAHARTAPCTRAHDQNVQGQLFEINCCQLSSERKHAIKDRSWKMRMLA